MTRTFTRRWLLAALGLGPLLAACAPAGGAPPAASPTASQTSEGGAPIGQDGGAPPVAPPTASPGRATAPTLSAPVGTATTGAVPAGTATRAGTASGATPGTAIAGCDNAAMTALVARFLDAYNAGDQERLLAFFPARAATRGLLVPGEETYFRWYWDVQKPGGRDGSGVEAYVRDELPHTGRSATRSTSACNCSGWMAVVRTASA